jgi:hypothetical protein
MLSLTNRSRLVVLWPHGPLPEGPITLPVDLAAFFRSVAALGPDAALLLLTIRALRLRAAYGDARVSDLGWILGVPRRWVARQLQHLADAGQLVFEATGNETIRVELTPPPDERLLFDDRDPAPGVRHEILTHWFTQLLPRLGRRGFLAYLYIRSHETQAVLGWFTLANLRAACGTRSVLGARMQLARLRRFGLVRHGDRGLVVVDPLPLRPLGRLYLRLLSAGAIPPTPTGRVLVLLVIAAPFVLVSYLLFR